VIDDATREKLLAALEAHYGADGREAGVHGLALLTEISETVLEAKRVARWWSTYNSALAGILSGCERGSEMDKKAHLWARSKANHAHGTLKPKVEKPA
jgi:hypothetical protein